ncbi:hypothetical protein [Nocardia sp. NPDC005366]|uniref:hypothetical protein n=1 Tax=Nocardia sp. NPDC005366 TaxID=3156878 RepID=UPI0033BE0F18
MKTYYMNQKPVEPLVFVVRDERGKARDLSLYDSAQVYITGTNNFDFDEIGGTAVITDADNGKVTFTFMGETVFVNQGKYRFQVKLIAGDRWDWTDIGEIEVRKGLDE